MMAANYHMGHQDCRLSACLLNGNCEYMKWDERFQIKVS